MRQTSTAPRRSAPASTLAYADAFYAIARVRGCHLPRAANAQRVVLRRGDAVTYSLYRLVLLVAAVVLGVLVWLVMHRTQIGIVARAVIMNEELAQVLGINTRLVRFRRS